MPLINYVKEPSGRLSALRWRDLLMDVTNGGLVIRHNAPPALKAAVMRDVTVIRRVLPGFAAFSASGRRGATAGKPAGSLLYHALASPLVVRDHLGRTLGGFPTAAELETLENFIFSL